MKPKTIIEKHLTALSASLAPLSAKMHTWAEQNIFLKWGVLSRGKFHCLECGHTWKPSQKDACAKFTNCATCGGKLKMQAYNKVHFREIEYSAVLDTMGGFQVVRIICSHKRMKKNLAPTYFHSEVMQHWINPKGEVRTLSLSTNLFAQTYDSWKYYSPLEIRPKNFINSQKYYLNPYKVYPYRKILPVLRRNGFKSGLYAIAPQVLLPALLKDSIAETLLKAPQVSLLYYYLSSRAQDIKENWQAVKTALKNNYVAKDWKIWEDYIALLRYFDKDLSCPALVCPENLNQAHDRLVAKKRELQRKKYLLRMRAEISSAQAVYEKEKKPFFDLRFTEQNLTILVMEHVQDFLEEGDSLGHCIFTNEYYKKKDSLILSAKVDNTPVETIEVSLSTMEIIQCRGMKNKNSKYHKQILRVLSKNLYKINQRIKKKENQNRYPIKAPAGIGS